MFYHVLSWFKKIKLESHAPRIDFASKTIVTESTVKSGCARFLIEKVPKKVE